MNRELLNAWGLDPSTVFLNHGSFGACPTQVLALQRRYIEQLERQPVRFYVRDLAPMMRDARSVLAEFVGAPADDLVWVDNATTGINTVLRSLTFEPGDEILLSNQEYNACRNAAEFVAKRSGARIKLVDIAYPISGPEAVVEAFTNAMTAETRLILIDHVVSQTGFVLPIEPIIKAARDRGIEVLVDGAHAPGMLPLDIYSLAPTYYTGNCHKWLCAPKAVAFLYVTPERQDTVRPLTISHGASAQTPRFRAEFDWTGTRDVSAALCVPEAIRVMSELGGGWNALRAHNHELVLAGRDILCDALGATLACPESMVGSLATLALPDATRADDTPLDATQDALYHDFGIEAPVIPWPAPPQRLLRISAQLYNDESDYQRLADALVGLI